MASSGAATTAGSAAADPRPAMPRSLQQLITTVEALTHSSSSSLPSPSPPTHDDATVVSTGELLQLVRSLQQQYIVLLDMAEHGFSTNDASPQQRSQGLNNAQVEADRRMCEFERTVARLQRGIRSKQAQSSRLFLLNALRREAAERRQCVAKMEGALRVAQQHLSL